MKKPYDVDEETRELIEVALNCLITLSEAQIQEDSADGLVAVADRLAEAFGIVRLDAEVIEHEDGEEIIYKFPKGGLFSDDDEPEEPKS